MNEHTPTYDEALSLLREFNESDSLLKHAYAVEGTMRYLARKHGEDELKWGIVGLSMIWIMNASLSSIATRQKKYLRNVDGLQSMYAE